MSRAGEVLINRTKSGDYCNNASDINIKTVLKYRGSAVDVISSRSMGIQHQTGGVFIFIFV
jgi:hypothetical protein